MSSISHAAFRDRALILNLIRDAQFSDLNYIEDNDVSYARFWLRYIEHCCFTDENLAGRAIDSHPKLEKAIQQRFDESLIALALSHCQEWVDTHLLDRLYGAYPQLTLLEATRLSAWHWYREALSDEKQRQYHARLTALPQPFNDERFSAIPVHSSFGSKYGKNSSLSHYQHAMSGVFLDAKLGLILRFKGKNAMVIGFNVNANGDLFVHQLQCCEKGRGHYRLGRHWRQALLGYLQQCFPKQTLYLLSPSDLRKLLDEQYAHTDDKLPTPLLDKIYHDYQALIDTAKAARPYRGLTYHHPSCLSEAL